ncbi:integral membrane protein [Apodospora peruviana]|uniref:Integral membrane protein n=1 Tax=Apodospora peruviana TaxID=516989 RepID=A0AAE0M0R0_9PEZI|nr:integral membrane protein [Apodospora peruviana]
MTPGLSPSDRQLIPPLRTSTRVRRSWDHGIPPVFRPLVRAYLLGYASAVAPRLLTLLLQHLTRRRVSQDGDKPHQSPSRSKSFITSLINILRGGLDWQRFPTFCAVIVGGSTLLQIPLKAAFDRLLKYLSDLTRKRLSRWFASFIAGWLSLQLLQSKESSGFTETVSSSSTSTKPPKTINYAGRTLDLSLFALTRALDVIGGELWARRKARRLSQGKHNWSPLEQAVSRLTDPAIFALSSGLIMWTWIYRPSRLPRAYNKWIGSAAAVDPRLIEALVRCRDGSLQYGRDIGQAPLLGGMCADYGWPLDWGDPAKSIPFPCEIVHMGCGANCEYHALSRFERSFRWCMATYLPLNLLLAIIRNPTRKSLARAFASAARSSAFLGAFIALFYYGVCLTRTRVGPRVLGKHAGARQTIDGGLCVGTGCLLCGWSIMIENAGRRKDVALFVAPRALATLLPRRYGLDKQWRETFVFAFSTAVVFTCVLENKNRVRGVLGNVLHTVLNP